jgi:SAM-dependent methyltransferase
MEREDHWQSVYRTKSEDEVSWFQERPSVSLDLIGRAGPGSLIDIGGGASRLADHLLGRDLTVLDVAEAALEQSRTRLGEKAKQVNWLVSDITQWVPDRTYDIWHDRAVFHFLTDPADRDAYRAVLARALRPGGQVIIGTFAADGPERCSGLPVYRYDAAGLAAEIGFSLEEALTHDHVTPAGKVQKFQYVRLIRRP